MRSLPVLLSLLLGFFCTAPVARGGRIYYTDQPNNGAGTVRAVGLDGTNPAVVATFPSPANLRGIGWHRASGRIFVLDNALGVKVIRSLLPNGTGIQTVTSVGNSASISSDLEVDEIENKLFWAETSQDPGVNGLVRSCNLDGSNVVTAVVAGLGTEFSPYFLFVDRPGGFIYWGVQQAASGQNNPTTFRRASFAGVIDPNFSILTPSRSRDIGIDPVTASAFWADRQQGAIYRRPIVGGVNQLVCGGLGMPNELNAPHGVALDIVARKVYWADTGQRGSAFQASARKVSRCNFDGTEYENLTTSDGTNEPWDLTLDLSSPTYAEWAARFFTAAAGLRLPMDDADGNGTPNLLDYAFDGNPRGAAPARLPGPVAVGTSLQYPRRRISPLTYRIEVSTDLLTWRYNGDGSGVTATVETAVTPLDAEMDMVTVSAAQPGATKMFFRVRVSTTEP